MGKHVDDQRPASLSGKQAFKIIVEAVPHLGYYFGICIVLVIVAYFGAKWLGVLPPKNLIAPIGNAAGAVTVFFGAAIGATGELEDMPLITVFAWAFTALGAATIALASILALIPG